MKEGRKMDLRSFFAIQARFKKVKGDLNILINNVKAYDELWAYIIIDFKSLETVIPQISTDGLNLLNIYSVRKRWVVTQSQLARYAHRVTPSYNLIFKD